MRVEGLTPQPLQRPAAPGLPISVIGLIGAAVGRSAGPPSGRSSSSAFATFLVTSLVFPVATTWGTFLHAAGPAQVLLVVSALLALDAVDRLGRARGRAGPGRSPGSARSLGVFGSLLFSVALLPSFGAGSRGDRRPLQGARRAAMAAVGHPLDASAGPVITNFPIWMAETMRIPALALPDEPPATSSTSPRPALRRRSSLVLLDRRRARHWPADPRHRRRRRVVLPASSTSAPAPTRPADDPLGDARAFEIVCP